MDKKIEKKIFVLDLQVEKKKKAGRGKRQLNQALVKMQIILWTLLISQTVLFS